MSIKVIERPDISAKRCGNKQELLAADIREMIRNRIEYCEFENFPYSEKTSMSDIMRKMIPVFADEFKKETGVYPKGYTRRYYDCKWNPPFLMKRVKDENGIHIYGTFYAKSWEMEIKEAKQPRD